MITFKEFITESKKSREKFVRSAMKFADKAHKGQTRSDGTPYIEHPTRVADLVGEYEKSRRTRAAAFLHDTIEDTDTSYGDIKSKFGKKVAKAVRSLTSDKSKIELMGKGPYLADKMVKMDDRSLTVKLADRIDNTSDLRTAKSPEWAQKYKEETQYILTHLEANRDLNDTHKSLIKKIKKNLKTI